mmetsp:Transcript_20916/g.31002  ORF Transcript_20916/g.31002 Transcript_20916/m.31002 type:complete len:118 (+) Transcript_20916:703-1056(+)
MSNSMRCYMCRTNDDFLSNDAHGAYTEVATKLLLLLLYTCTLQPVTKRCTKCSHGEYVGGREVITCLFLTLASSTTSTWSTVRAPLLTTRPSRPISTTKKLSCSVLPELNLLLRTKK